MNPPGTSAPGRRRPGRRPAALVTLLALLLQLLWLAPGAGPSAHAETAAAPLRVSISSQAPSGTSKSTLVLRGTVENTSDKPVSGVQVHLWRSTDALGDGDALREALASAPDNPLGSRLLGFEAGNIFNITDVGGQPSQAFGSPKPSFGPGEKANFVVRAKVAGEDSLGFSSPGAYLVGVQVRGIPQGEQNQTVGRARSLFVQADATTDRRAASLVLLNARPTMLADGVFANNQLADELSGRLGALLALAKQGGTTLLVDPALYDELTAMADGYRVRGSTDAAPTTRGQQAAKNFLAQLTPLLATGRAYRTLYGSPDVALAVASHREDLVTGAGRALPAQHPMASLPLAVVPADGKLDGATLQALAGLEPDVVLAANVAATAPVQRREGIRLVHYEPTAFDGGPLPEPNESTGQLVSRLQAQQYLSSQPTVTLVSTAGQAAAEQVPAAWRSRIPLADLVSDADPVDAEWLPGPGPQPDPGLMQHLEATGQNIEAWGELVDQREQAGLLANRVLAQGISTSWQGEAPAARGWLAGVRGQVGSLLGSSKVQLHVVEDFVTSADSQEIPVTVTNGLAEAIRVKVVFTSENPQRIDVEDSEVRTVGAGESETIRVRVSTRANGQVGVTAALATSTGRQLGSARDVTITATQAGRVGWIIIIASGAVFLLGTAVRIRQVQAERRNAEPGEHGSNDEHGSHGNEHGGPPRSTLVRVSPDSTPGGTLDQSQRRT